MAEKKKLLFSIADTLSPGVATAAAQAGLSKGEQAQIAAFGELKKTHQFLVTLPQDDAYKNFQGLTPEYQDALKTFFSPKYAIQDKGFLGNIGRSIASSAHYAAQTFKELGMQIAGIPIQPQNTGNPAQALLQLGVAPAAAISQELGITEPAKKATGKILETVMRPAGKLIRQPYQAQRLYEEATNNTLLQDYQNLARTLGQGFTELLPGGTDATIADNSTTWKKYWEQASDKENVFDSSEVVKIESSLTSDAAYVGKLLAGKKNFIDNYEEILKRPDALDLIQRYTAGDVEAKKIVANAVSLYEQAKISPGRDVARALASAFPFEADKAKDGDPINKAFFNTVSGGLDFTVTFGLDPLILIGKAKRTADVARFGLMKMGEDPRNLEKAFRNSTVRNYWNQVGKLFTKYNEGDVVQKGAVLTRIQERFPEINLDVAQYMAPNIKDADTALEFFRGGDIIDDISRGNAGLRRDPLIPRYTKSRYIKDWLRDGALNSIEKIAGKYEAIKLPGNVDDIARLADENNISWAEKIGYKEVTTSTGIRSIFAGRGKTANGVKTEGKFVSKDASTAAKIDRVMRQFSIAPSQERIISISDATSSTQVYRLLRTVVDKGTASTFRAAWIASNEGQRLLMYKGLVKTLAYGMGLDHSESGRTFIAKIDDTARELYSVNQSALDLGDWSRILGTLKPGQLAAPEGVRKLVAEATDKATAEGKANRVLASTGQEMAAIKQQIDELKALKKQLIAKTSAGIVAKPKSEFEQILSIHPRLTQTGAEFVGLVKTNFLKKYTEFDRTITTGARPDSPETIAKITSDLREGRGFTDPLIVAYNVDKEGNLSILLTEGNHRLAAAINVGLAEVPVKFVRAYASEAKVAKIVGKSKIKQDASGYIPGSVNPRDLLPESALAKLENIQSPLAAISGEEAATIKSIVSDIDNSLKILGGTMGKMKVARKSISNYIELDPIDVDVFNAAELNGAQRGVRAYQLSQKRYMPNLVDLRKFELRGNVFSAITGKVGESVVNQKATDIWSYLNLYPRLGVRTTVEEVGTAILIGGTEGIANYFRGFATSQAARKASAPSLKISSVRKIEKEVSPLGILSRNLYKITRQNYTKEQILKMADNPEELAQAIGKSLLKDRFKPGFLQTAKGKRAAGYAEDWVTNGGNEVMQEINGAIRQAEFKADVAEETASYLRQYGPSVALNADITAALKDVKFKSVYGEIAYNRTDFLLNWYLDLHNTIGKRNIFGQIVFSNIYKKEEDAIEAVRTYLDGKGNELAKKFAIYNSEGSYEFARRIYADATNNLRDYSGRLNKGLIEEIKVSGGIDNFDFKQLHKYNENFQMPKTVLGRELIPLESGDSVGFFDRVMKNGYAWVGKQIAILDREPITYGNYIMYRDDLIKYQGNLKQGLLEAGIDDAVAEKLARSQSHEVAISLARQRTLGYVDNSDIRTNLAFNLRNFGRYYRATEDFYRRVGRLGKYEKRALVRFAIINQTFEHSGFVHKDSNGELYFTYPGDDVLNYVLGNTVFRIFGIPGAQPMSSNFGGKLKMLTPSLDPQSAPPRLGGPFIGLSVAVLENIPVIGSWIRAAEPIVTGGIPNQEWWRSFTPINVQRLIDMGIKNDKVAMTEQKYSATVQGMRLLVSTGNGPKTGADINSFSTNAVIQATNIMALRFVTGLGAPASVQMFATKDVPKEMIDAGYFTWDSEFAKILKRYANDEHAFEKAFVQFATLYPSKTVYTVAKTTSETEAAFQKTYEAANFVKKNVDLVTNHKQAAAFFIPISGTSDLNAYTYLKSQGFVKNKQLEDFLREASTADARQQYNTRKDLYDQTILETQDTGKRRYLREQWKLESDFFKQSYPLLRMQLERNDGYLASKVEALDDLRNVVYSGKAPDKKLAEVFGAMILQYDNGKAQLDGITGKRDYDTGYKKAIKADLKDVLRQLAGNNPNAKSLYWNLFETLIGE